MVALYPRARPKSVLSGLAWVARLILGRNRAQIKQHSSKSGTNFTTRSSLKTKQKNRHVCNAAVSSKGVCLNDPEENNCCPGNSNFAGPGTNFRSISVRANPLTSVKSFLIQKICEHFNFYTWYSFYTESKSWPRPGKYKLKSCLKFGEKYIELSAKT